jgi:hypothetical protein
MVSLALLLGVELDCLLLVGLLPLAVLLLLLLLSRTHGRSVWALVRLAFCGNVAVWCKHCCCGVLWHAKLCLLLLLLLLILLHPTKLLLLLLLRSVLLLLLPSEHYVV